MSEVLSREVDGVFKSLDVESRIVLLDLLEVGVFSKLILELTGEHARKNRSLIMRTKDTSKQFHWHQLPTRQLHEPLVPE